MSTDAVSHDPFAALPPELHPNIDHIVTEDGAPVDSLFSEKQMRLLTESLQTSWPGPGDGGNFVAMANVGLFFSVSKPPFVPDMLLSVNVELPKDLFPKNCRSYFLWEYGKPPEVVIEVVSNREGGEDSTKLNGYAAIGIPYYVIFDPALHLSREPLRVFRCVELKYERISDPFWFSGVDLGVRLWEGQYEDHVGTWLRWFNSKGALIPTGKESTDTERQRADYEHEQAETERQRANYEREKAEVERQKAEAERQKADVERQKAEAERTRADRLAAELRRLGVDPDIKL